MSSSKLAGRAFKLSGLAFLVKQWKQIATTFVLVTAVAFMTPTAAMADVDCATEGVDCVIPKSINWSSLQFLAEPISWVLNILMLIVALIALFTSVTSLIGVLRAVKANNQSELRSSAITLVVALLVLVLCATGLWFTFLGDAISQISGDLS